MIRITKIVELLEMSKNNKLNYWLILAIVISGLKIFIIDMDIPAWDLSYYQPIDEGYYTFLAYNQFEFGSLAYSDDLQVLGRPLITNLLTYVGLNLFGDNYLGLRFSSYISGITCLILFWIITKKLTENAVIRVCALLFFTFNFTFNVAGVVVEPTMVRMLSMLFVLLILISYYEKIAANKIYIVLFSLFTTGLCFFTYPTNVFTTLGVFLALAIYPNIFQVEKSKFNINYKALLSTSFLIAIGFIVALFIYLIVVDSMGGNVIDTLFYRGNSHGDRVGLSVGRMINNLKNISLANIFLTNPLFFIVAFTSLYRMLILDFKKLKKETIFIMFFLLSIFFQSIFINDYSQRKLIILLPLLLFLIIGGFKDDTVISFNIKKIKNWVGLLIGFVVMALAFRYSVVNKYVLLIPILLSIGVYLYGIKNQLKFNSKLIVIITTLLLVLPEIYLGIKYFLLERKYHYKEVMVELSKYDNQNFIGGYSMGFRMENSINAFVNPYFYYNKEDVYWSKIDSLSNNGKIDYSISYKEDEQKFDSIGFEPIKVLLSSDQTVNGKEVILFREVKP